MTRSSPQCLLHRREIDGITFIFFVLFTIAQTTTQAGELSTDIDWSHLSNIRAAYDTHSIKTFIHQRDTIVFTQPAFHFSHPIIQPHPATLTASITSAAAAFLQSLPAFRSLSRSARKHLCETNLRPLIFPNLYELNHSCFSEPWQVR